MDLNEVKKNWESFGETDPFFSILVDSSKKGGKWGASEFFATGVNEIVDIMSKMDSLGLIPRHHRALDFGCGVGRLTQPLGTRFDEVLGIDISSNMVSLANRLNTAPNCRFVVNERGDLSLFPDDHFDFVLSLITLQHMEPKYAKSYLREFMRVLSRGGVLYFGIPDRRKGLTNYGMVKVRAYECLAGHRHAYSLYRTLRRPPKVPSMEMHGIARTEVKSLMESAGGKVEFIENDSSNNWLSYRYCIRKS